MSVRARPERMLVVWCPDWPVAAAGVSPDVPAAVLRTNRVVACSAAARDEGVRRGLRRREAQGRCPHLVVLTYDPGRDARAFEPILVAVEALATRVEVIRPGACALGTLGPSRYVGGEDRLVDQVTDAVAATGHQCRIGVADGSFAAGLAARAGVIVPAGGSAGFVAPMSVDVLERPQLAGLLVRLGIATLGQFAALPASDVLARFGTDGQLAYRLARGLDDRPLNARVPPPDLVVQAELDPPADRVDTVAFLAKSLADQLHDRLGAQGLACTRLAIEAETENGESLLRLWRHDGALSPTGMVERVRWQIDGWLSGAGSSGAGGANRPTAGITLLRLTPDQVMADSGRQLGFWGANAETAERAARAFARVQGLLGPQAVVTAVVGGGRGPGEQVELVAWGDVPEATERATPPWPGRVPSPSPATVFAEPVAARVQDAEGRTIGVGVRTGVSAAPARVKVGSGPTVAVQAWAGPWMADERWWDRPAHRRRARFQVVTADGAAWLLALEAGSWWAEASYD